MRGHVLITRPDTDAQEIAELVLAKNYQVTCEPFLKVVHHDVDLLDIGEYAGLVFTSTNAVRAFCQNSPYRDLPVFVVGDQTSNQAMLAGFGQVKSASGKVDDLIDLLTKHPSDKPYLYIRSKQISHPLDIEDKGVLIKEKVLYHTEKKEQISIDVMNSLKEGHFSHILFFSKRTAEAFVDIIGGDLSLHEGLKSSKALCLGDSMLQCLSVLPWADIQLAGYPDRKGILSLLDD